MSGPPVHVAVVGGGLAGIAAALECADRGARVTLIERRRRLGGLTWSFQHSGMWVDNGQHVFLRCCTEYTTFLKRIGAMGDVVLQDRLDIPVVAPPSSNGAPRVARLRRSALPAPLHLSASLAGYRHLPVRDRLGLGRAALALRRLDLEDPALDTETFGAWLARHGQSDRAIETLWDLITVPTVNLPAAEASLAMAAKVFQTGLLTDSRAADIGWSRVPLGRLHGEHALSALHASGVTVRLSELVSAVSDGDWCRYAVRLAGGRLEVDAVVLAVPHGDASGILPPASVPAQERLDDLGSSAIVGVHLVFDRPVTGWPFFAGADTPVQFVFDRTESSGLGARDTARGTARGPQYLAVSLSAADRLLARHPSDLLEWTRTELTRLAPRAADARLVDGIVTKERAATFRALPGTAALRPSPASFKPRLALAGAWTNTGWPATMEGAVRSGRQAARAVLSIGDLQGSKHNKEVA